MTIVIDGVQCEPYTSPTGGRGRRRKFDEVAFLQAVADGKSITEAGRSVGMACTTINAVLIRLRRENGVKTTTQLVAHFLRNRWID